MWAGVVEAWWTMQQNIYAKLETTKTELRTRRFAVSHENSWYSLRKTSTRRRKKPPKTQINPSPHLGAANPGCPEEVILGTVISWRSLLSYRGTLLACFISMRNTANSLGISVVRVSFRLV
jgi:hypothetical protein